VARLLADEDFSKPVVLLLRVDGHDAVTVQELGRDRAPDGEVLALGMADGRAVLTFNRNHFWALHQITPGHAGIITCTRDNNVSALAARIDAAIAGGNLVGRLIPVTKPHPSKP
jgi:predicted nuclease of predicted toxin-antitoxin system